MLVKTVVEVGGWEVLNGSESWVRGLLAILAVCSSSLFICFPYLTTNSYIEYRVDDIKRVVHNCTYQNLCDDSPISDSNKRDYHSNFADLCDIVL